MAFKKQLYIPNKRDYILGKDKPNVSCILCSVLEDHPDVTNLLIWKNSKIAVCANLYPYNAGHLLIFPFRHIKDPRELEQDEIIAMHKALNFSMEKLEEIYHPSGFNIGFNVGEASGASIEHLHQHIVPRYSRELGFVDITSGSKIIIEDPNTTLEKMRDAFSSLKL